MKEAEEEGGGEEEAEEAEAEAEEEEKKKKEGCVFEPEWLRRPLDGSKMPRVQPCIHPCIHPSLHSSINPFIRPPLRPPWRHDTEFFWGLLDLYALHRSSSLRFPNSMWLSVLAPRAARTNEGNGVFVFWGVFLFTAHFTSTV